MLSVDGLICRYGRIEALHQVSFSVRPGELVALVGSNGAGKTTLLKALSGIQSIVAGQILLDGAAIDRMPAHQRVRRGLAQVPQGRQIFSPLSVEDNLVLGAWTQQRMTGEDLDRIYGLFPILGEFRRRAAGSLSGGQQQMLAIGRALMSRPKVLLLDEPSMGLAPMMIEQIFQIFKALQRDGMTILVVEQNVQSILKIADRGYVLDRGTVTIEGRGHALLADPRVQAAYLGL